MVVRSEISFKILFRTDATSQFISLVGAGATGELLEFVVEVRPLPRPVAWLLDGGRRVVEGVEHRVMVAVVLKRAPLVALKTADLPLFAAHVLHIAVDKLSWLNESVSLPAKFEQRT